MMTQVKQVCHAGMTRCSPWVRFLLDRRTSPPTRAREWVSAQELGTGGIRVHNHCADAYPEVSGYLIPTLLACGEKALALRLARWLQCVQRADGSFPDATRGVPHVFDTGQVLRGLLAVEGLDPAVSVSARRAVSYLTSRLVDGGRKGFGTCYAGEVPETVQLYTLVPLREFAVRMQDGALARQVDQALEFYTQHPDCLQLVHLTHFLGYELEALLDLNRAELALPLLEELACHQAPDGSVPALSGARWVCLPGLAQLAICWYKTGRVEPADRALGWLERHQNRSGGFRGSLGPGARYFPRDELSWAAKFYLDAHQLRLRHFFRLNVDRFPDTVETTDGRLQAVRELVKPHDRILEVGCGKGRFLKALTESGMPVRCEGVDLSPELLACVPPSIETRPGLLEDVPHAADTFDVTFSVEAIEHSTNVPAAVTELVRVTKPGGWVVIVEKPASAWGRLVCPPWERWPSRRALSHLLRRSCGDVSARPVACGSGTRADGLMVAWKGRKRGLMDGAEWHHVLVRDGEAGRIVHRLRSNKFSDWGREVLLATNPGESVLEVGSGTGEMSLALAQAGRKVTVLDVSERDLEFVAQCAGSMGLSVARVRGDALRPLPFADGTFDCVWSSGLLEHFDRTTCVKVLAEQARVARRRVICLVPNASCMAYQQGKRMLEESGRWEYGREVPRVSLRDEFTEAGLHITAEFSTGVHHGLEFVRARPVLFGLWRWIQSSMGPDLLARCNQGYMLITVGEPRHAAGGLPAAET